MNNEGPLFAPWFFSKPICLSERAAVWVHAQSDRSRLGFCSGRHLPSSCSCRAEVLHLAKLCVPLVQSINCWKQTQQYRNSHTDTDGLWESLNYFNGIDKCTSGGHDVDWREKRELTPLWLAGVGLQKGLYRWDSYRAHSRPPVRRQPSVKLDLEAQQRVCMCVFPCRLLSLVVLLDVLL